MHRSTARTAAALTVVVLGLAACSADNDASAPSSVPPSDVPPSDVGATSPGPSMPVVEPGQDWTLGLDSQPTRSAVAGERVYLSSAGGARFPPQIYLIDATTGQEVRHRTATGQPFDLLMAPDGRLWVAGDRHPDQLGGAGINVHDPVSLVVVEHADTPGQAYSLALVGEEIWVGSDDAVFVLDPSTRDLLRTIPIGGPAYQLVVLPGGDGVLAIEGDRLERLGVNGVPTASQAVPSDGNVVVAATSTTLFVRAPVSADSTVLTMDPTLTTPGSPIGVDTDSGGGGLLTTAAGDVLLVDDRRDEVLCLPGGAAPAVHIPADDLVGVLADLPDGRVLFATSSGVAARMITC